MHRGVGSYRETSKNHRFGYAGTWVAAVGVGLAVAMLCTNVVTAPTESAGPRLLTTRTVSAVTGQPVRLVGPGAIGIPHGADRASGVARADRGHRPPPTPATAAVPPAARDGLASPGKPPMLIRTYQVDGGAVTVECSGRTVTPLTVAARPGYQWRVQRQPDGGITVTFGTDVRATVLYVRLDGATPGATSGATPAPTGATDAAAHLRATAVEYRW